MNAYVVSLSKYVNTGLLVCFTLLAYAGFAVRGNLARRVIEIVQRLILAAFLVNANFAIAWIVKGSAGRKLLLLCAMEILFLLSFMVLYRIVHEMANMLLFNNICMLLSIGFVMISRIAFYGDSGSTGYRSNEPIKQFVMASAGLMIMLIIPLFRRFFDAMRHLGIIFGIAGIIALDAVLLLSSETNGAMITYTLARFTFQPSEFVKILYILMLAGLLSAEVTFERGILATILAAVHVGILVLSTDLGSALIFFAVYLMMLFMASGRWSVLAGGAGLGAVSAIVLYTQFQHVQDRVLIWKDPFSDIDGRGFQIAQSLFAISYGGPWGAGLTQGMPTKIPYVESDFIFAAITEEMGLVFGICLLLLCVNCFLRILALSASYSNRFFQLFTYGAAVCYIFQTFLTVGGETKFIPLTGVTLPLVSYGGSSILSTLIMFGMIEMIFILHEERTAHFMERYEMEHAGEGFPEEESGVPPGDFPEEGLMHAGRQDVIVTDPSSHGFTEEGLVPAGSLGEDSGTGNYKDYYKGFSSDEVPDGFPVNGISEEGIFEDT
ncbi:MAG: FtsW/RodA/SpoVE family cell cycle protein [Eubacteriales bacterium]|nr:FtsW/RodA/SpoVE family cell cycle protein [Eubacteriales bacterium]